MGSSDNNFLQEFFGRKGAKELPLIPLKDTVVFPRIAVPIVVRRDKSLKALEDAMKKNRIVVFAAQKDQDAADPGTDGLYAVGTVAKVREMMKQKDKTVRLVVEGVGRVRILGVTPVDGHLRANVEALPDPQVKKTERIEALMYSALNQFRRVVNMGANVPFDVLLVIMNVTDPWLFGDLVAANLELKVSEKQEVLESADIDAKLDAVGKALGRQIKLLQMASKIQQETGKELDKMQREVFLREQMKSIERELETIGGKTESDDLKEKLDKAGMPAAAKEKAVKEYERLRAMPSFSPEISYLRTYLEWLADLPWDKKDASEIDITQSKKILDQDHFGLAKAKERIIEYLAVGKLVGRIRGPILCFVGPPGVGKTSIGKSIARALGRKFFRMSLGGVRDEAEIRGHRRTYVGALPGRIIQGIATVKTRNPVFMLDEIDKVGADFRGDPSAALLEALDPEQNNSFSDHYLELPFDLSDVMFITTANVLDTIPPALRDRMEVIEFPGYTDEEKLKIAERHLIPKALKDNGLTAAQCAFSDTAIRRVIRAYTREAGVRNLEREIASVCRKIARAVAEKKTTRRRVGPGDIAAFLGPAKFTDGLAEKKDEVGVVTGLAWTEVGGEILQIEATKMPGRGNLTLTGHLGEVMQESAKAAYSYARSAAIPLGVKGEFYKDNDIHVHVPSGAIPKDGPSAGVAMATALISMLTGRKVRSGVAMTGEITLRGHVLEIGGVKEKVLAAHRAGITTVIMPKDNEKDLVEIPAEIRKKLKFVFAKEIRDVLDMALLPAPPAPRSKK
ncbi:MAG TPA: endopeptidase La [Candidatus Eisenbacteria bacterium]|nr:endopeptidase La [Candidatus Eisenbacteria bacterium]